MYVNWQAYTTTSTHQFDVVTVSKVVQASIRVQVWGYTLWSIDMNYVLMIIINRK